MALTSGASVISGGTTIAEESLTAGAGGALTLSNTAVAVSGSIIGWYRKPSDDNWTVVAISGNQMVPDGAQQGDTYCVKYFYVDQNAKSMAFKADYVPAVVHLVLIADEYAGISADDAGASRYGKLVIDIPAFQLAGGQELSLSSGSAATISLNGNALAISQGDSCDEELVFGTITEQVSGAQWQNDVLAIAPEDGELQLAASATETLAMRVIFKGLMAAQRKSNDNFDFRVVSGSARVSAAGVVTGAAGSSVIGIKLKNAPNVPEAYAYVTAG